MSNVLILGGDGYLGWPAAIYFSARGHDVTVVDNGFRRKVQSDLNLRPLYPVPDLIGRAKLWYELTGYQIAVIEGDLCDYDLMRSLFSGGVNYNWYPEKRKFLKPDFVVHFAEQPSAPFSMMNFDSADMTLVNNLRVTNNLIWAVKEHSIDTHIIKLGTMGEYGTPNIDIEEGWLTVQHNGRSQQFLYPRQASSLYHTTKIMDTDLLWFAVRTWGLRVTDLMQGPVYGLRSPEMDMDQNLGTIFNYDEIFGTVINRFVVQAVCGYPLTVYGEGNQQRGFINLVDSLACIEKASLHPPELGKLNIFNQITETFSVRQLADLVKTTAQIFNIECTINPVPNPRVEAEDHYYNPKFEKLEKLGFTPSKLTDEIGLPDLIERVLRYRNNIDKDIIFNSVKW